jgi:dihydrolipoamide dehydrogenase
MSVFDVAVIGGGPGGYVAAIRAVQQGMKVLLTEEVKLGGTCLNLGCIPTKCFLSDVEKLENVKKSRVIVGSGSLRIDVKRMQERKNNTVKMLMARLESLLKGYGIKVVLGHGEIVNPKTLRVKNREGKAEDYECRNIIIATGAEVSAPPFIKIDGKRVITSDEALGLDEIPNSIIIIGGGVIGVEFATIFKGLGSKVSILEMLPDIIMKEDQEVREGLRKILERDGIQISVDSKVTAVKTGGNSVLISFTDSEGKRGVAKANKALVATGRLPNTKGLGLERLGIEMEWPFIHVNDRMETNIPGIYAIGDVIGKVMLAHAASAEGDVAIENISGKRVGINYSMVPNCIFTCPEIASIGLTEEEARQKRSSIKVGNFPFSYNAKAVASEAVDGFAKIIADNRTGEILGVHILGDHATDLVGEVLLAMSTEAVIEDLGKVIKGHPTLSEIVKEMALDADGLALHLLRAGKGV